MNIELIPIAFAGYLIYKGVENYLDSSDVTPGDQGEVAAETFESEYSLEYINPTPISGSTDIHGAESINRSFRPSPSHAHGRAFGAELVATQQTQEIMTSTGLVAPGQQWQPNADYDGVHVGYAYNDLTPITSNGHSTGVEVHAPAVLNPRDYQTISGLTGWPLLNDSNARGASRGAYATSGDPGPSFNYPAGYYDVANDFMPEYRFPFPWAPTYNPLGSATALNYQMVAGY
tara:strand:+ start:751 stop:1446 length:696 start_codon:yes stop_codon:yes gene_type:complete